MTLVFLGARYLRLAMTRACMKRNFWYSPWSSHHNWWHYTHSSHFPLLACDPNRVCFTGVTPLKSIRSQNLFPNIFSFSVKSYFASIPLFFFRSFHVFPCLSPSTLFFPTWLSRSAAPPSACCWCASSPGADTKSARTWRPRGIHWWPMGNMPTSASRRTTVVVRKGGNGGNPQGTWGVEWFL